MKKIEHTKSRGLQRCGQTTDNQQQKDWKEADQFRSRQNTTFVQSFHQNHPVGERNYLIHD